MEQPRWTIRHRAGGGRSSNKQGSGRAEYLFTTAMGGAGVALQLYREGVREVGEEGGEEEEGVERMDGRKRREMEATDGGLTGREGKGLPRFQTVAAHLHPLPPLPPVLPPPPPPHHSVATPTPHSFHRLHTAQSTESAPLCSTHSRVHLPTKPPFPHVCHNHLRLRLLRHTPSHQSLSLPSSLLFLSYPYLLSLRLCSHHFPAPRVLQRPPPRLRPHLRWHLRLPWPHSLVL